LVNRFQKVVNQLFKKHYILEGFEILQANFSPKQCFQKSEYQLCKIIASQKHLPVLTLVLKKAYDEISAAMTSLSSFVYFVCF